MVILMFFQAVYFVHFLSFYTMQLELPKLKGRLRVVRSVRPLFRLRRGSTPRSIRERVKFLKLACLYWGWRTV